MDVMWLLKDFNNFALYTVTDAAINVASVAGIWLIAARFNGIGGMGIYQVLFMLGYSLMVNGLISTFFSFNVYFISRIIGRGQMDHVLIMPQPVWVTLLTEGFTPVSGSGVLLSGIGVTTFALSRIDNLVSVPFVIALVGCIGLSVIISLSFSFMWGSLAFYSPVGAEEVCTSAGSLSWLSGFPLNGLESVSKYVMLSVLPIGLYAWFPSMALMGLSSSLNIALLAFIALAYLSLVLFFFTRGLKHYVKNGSYRYLDRGHRR
ncbi:MAG: hypothetical protein A2147_02465 [Chloroflexi bacterium RBG_16_57_8]|nr:MAG: hypothetical protein A2147_02465 [Chloroflexi bacterium RBG_16_57_8]